MKIAYLDCFCGLSGDMFLGALLDAGLSLDELRRRLNTLPLRGYQLRTSREPRHAIFGTRLKVDSTAKNQPPRNLDTIREIIRQAQFSETVIEKSIAIFDDLARVEGKIHNRPAAEIHFHEVGAVDSIVDIVGSVYGLERLGIESLYVSPLPLGGGFTQTAHGRLPLPAPATLALLQGIPVENTEIRQELVTPTGAVLVKNLGAAFGRMPPMVVQNMGYGVGARDLPERPNLLRILIGEPSPETDSDTVVVLETNVDDMNPEWSGYLMERLFAAGALDATFTPLQMKKNRPGFQIRVIGPPHRKDLLLETIFADSTTLGVRYRYEQRKILQRELIEVDSPWGKATVKRILRPDGSRLYQPEYETCRRIAAENNRPLREIYSWFLALNN